MNQLFSLFLFSSLEFNQRFPFSWSKYKWMDKIKIIDLMWMNIYLEDDE